MPQRMQHIDQSLKKAWDALSQCCAGKNAFKVPEYRDKDTLALPPIVVAIRSLTATVELLVEEVRELKRRVNPTED